MNLPNNLEEVAKNLVQKGKGIFAADAGPETLGKRMQEAGIGEVGVETRKKYHEIIFSTPNLSNYISGIILHDEAVAGFATLIKNSGILPGVKVDGGLIDAPNYPGEKLTLGLDGLDARLEKYAAMGIAFTKWRAVIKIANNLPSLECIQVNANLLAEYAKKAQNAGLVPIIEPEILHEGEYDIDVCAKLTKLVGLVVFRTLEEKQINLAGIVYKPNMVIPGKDCLDQSTVEEIAKKTVETFLATIPDGVPGVAFLSGGQDAKQATLRLNEIAKIGVDTKLHWTFSFERALEGPAMQTWGGRPENAQKAQQILLHRAQMNSLASLGMYNQEEDL